MEINSIRPEPKSKLSIFVYILGILAVGLLVYFGGDLLKLLNKIGGKAALSVDILNAKAEVYVNGNYVGTTPYDTEDLTPGKNKITLSSDGKMYETEIKFINSKGNFSKSVIHNVGIFRDLGVSDFFSSGQEFWFDEDANENVLRIVSNPQGAKVYVDGTELGETPFISTTLSDGAYDLTVETQGHEAQKARINVKKGYTLNVSLTLFPIPYDNKITLPEGSSLYVVETANLEILKNMKDWSRALVYYNLTRGLELAGGGIKKERIFDYYLDLKGNLYDETGKEISQEELLKLGLTDKTGAYLTSVDASKVLSAEAKAVYEKLGATSSSSVEILETGTGWLRVRDEPSLNGIELARAVVGKTYSVLEEQTGWVKIKVDEEIEGWVSSDYVKSL